MNILVIDDIPEFAEMVAEKLRKLAPRYSAGPIHVEIVTGPQTAERARKYAMQPSARSAVYDLVVLDINLGDHALTGIDILACFKRYNSAWMVALFTGIDGDTTADFVLGEDRAQAIRRQLRADGMKSFFPDRLTVMEKKKEIGGQMEQLLALYEHISAQRFVFRPLSIGLTNPPTIFWQIRYNCGDLVTIPDYAGFTTLWLLLKGQTVSAIRAGVAEPDTKRGTARKAAVRPKPVAARNGTPPNVEGLARDYAIRKGIKQWDNLIFMEVMNEIQEAIIELASHLATQIEEGALPDNEKTSVAALRDKLGEDFADVAAAMAERNAATNPAPVPLPEISREDAAGGIRPKGKSRSASTPSEVLGKKAQEDFRNRKRNYLRRFEQYGLEDLAEHLDLTLVSRRGQGWQYVGKLPWTTE